MPIYEYQCDDCGTTFEKLVRGSQTATAVECPSCGEGHVTEQLSRFSAHAGLSSRGSSREQTAPSCGGGMCGMPGGMCGRN
jgi:putative FmdB family regulatory protein